MIRISKLIVIVAILTSFIAVTAAMAAEEDFSKTACWKRGKPRGVGVVPTRCASGMDKDAGLCYPHCDTNKYKPVGPICWEKCKEGYKDDGLTCRRDVHIIGKKSYKTGEHLMVGSRLKQCAQGEEKSGRMCYEPCKDGYKRVVNYCWSICPEGYKDDGATCRRDAHIYSPANIKRGVGKPITECEAGKVKQAGLCYAACPAGYKGVGPVCWPVCSNAKAGGVAMRTECGAACSTTPDACAKWSQQWATAGFKVLVSAVSAIATEDPSKCEGLLEAQKAFPTNIPDCQ
jgi:hypothetical protein